MFQKKEIPNYSVTRNLLASNRFFLTSLNNSNFSSRQSNLIDDSDKPAPTNLNDYFKVNVDNACNTERSQTKYLRISAAKFKSTKELFSKSPKTCNISKIIYENNINKKYDNSNKRQQTQINNLVDNLNVESKKKIYDLLKRTKSVNEKDETPNVSINKKISFDCNRKSLDCTSLYDRKFSNRFVPKDNVNNINIKFLSKNLKEKMKFKRNDSEENVDLHENKIRNSEIIDLKKRDVCKEAGFSSSYNPLILEKRMVNDSHIDMIKNKMKRTNLKKKAIFTFCNKDQEITPKNQQERFSDRSSSYKVEEIKKSEIYDKKPTMDSQRIIQPLCSTFVEKIDQYRKPTNKSRCSNRNTQKTMNCNPKIRTKDSKTMSQTINGKKDLFSRAYRSRLLSNDINPSTPAKINDSSKKNQTFHNYGQAEDTGNRKMSNPMSERTLDYSK